MTDPCISRRSLLRTLAAAGVTTIAAGVLVACGESEGTAASSAEGAADGASPASTPGSAAIGEPDPAGSAEGDPAGVAAAGIALADVVVGEARVVDVDGRRIVVAQPSAGSVVAYSAVCTHQQVIVEAAGGLLLRCPQHGSEFDAGDGTATKGPARAPLPPVTAAVDGDRIVFS